MTIIINIYPIQIGNFQGFQKVRVGRGYKEAYVGVREISLG